MVTDQKILTAKEARKISENSKVVLSDEEYDLKMIMELIEDSSNDGYNTRNICFFDDDGGIFESEEGRPFCLDYIRQKSMELGFGIEENGKYWTVSW